MVVRNGGLIQLYIYWSNWIYCHWICNQHIIYQFIIRKIIKMSNIFLVKYRGVQARNIYVTFSNSGDNWFLEFRLPKMTRSIYEPLNGFRWWPMLAMGEPVTSMCTWMFLARFSTSALTLFKNLLSTFCCIMNDFHSHWDLNIKCSYH